MGAVGQENGAVPAVIELELAGHKLRKGGGAFNATSARRDLVAKRVHRGLRRKARGRPQKSNRL